MPNYRTTVHTTWSAQKAFDYLSDLEHFVDWDPGVKRSVQVAGDGAALGAAYDVTVGGFPRDITLRYETMDFDPPRRIEVSAESSTLRSIDVMTFVDSGDGGCDVTYDADLVLTGLLAVGNPILGLVFNRIGDRAAAGLRSALEGTAV